MAQDLVEALDPERFLLVGEFNVRGGTYPTIEVKYSKSVGWG